uniref:Uncharacterized protein n=1 Tax=Heliothis virescens TaxID=7102 RepID=A0A2A4JFC9_HELVI
MDFSQYIINNKSEEYPNNVNNDTLIIMNERIPLAINNIPLENCENIRHHGPVMVVDMNGTIYLQNEIDSDDNPTQQPGGTLLQGKSRKRLKNVDKWKKVASKAARLKGSPYHSTVAKISHEKRLQIFNEFWKTCTSWDQRRQFIANNVTKETKTCNED